MSVLSSYGRHWSVGSLRVSLTNCGVHGCLDKAGAVLSLAGLLLAGCASSERESVHEFRGGVVAAREFRLIGRDGALRGQMVVDEDGESRILLYASGNQGLDLGVPSVAISTVDDGGARIVLVQGKSKVAIETHGAELGGAQISMEGGALGHVGWEFGIAANNEPVLSIKAPNGRDLLRISASPMNYRPRIEFISGRIGGGFEVMASRSWEPLLCVGIGADRRCFTFEVNADGGVPILRQVDVGESEY